MQMIKPGTLADMKKKEDEFDYSVQLFCGQNGLIYIMSTIKKLEKKSIFNYRVYMSELCKEMVAYNKRSYKLQKLIALLQKLEKTGTIQNDNKEDEFSANRKKCNTSTL